MTSAAKLATLKRHWRRIWALCYRMVGDRAFADDLAAQAIARALERAEQAILDPGRLARLGVGAIAS